MPNMKSLSYNNSFRQGGYKIDNSSRETYSKTDKTKHASEIPKYRNTSKTEKSQSNYVMLGIIQDHLLINGVVE